MIKYENEYLCYNVPVNINFKYLIKLSLYKFASVYYSIIMSIFRPKIRYTKYKVAICAIFRNEAKYLKEWIEYHNVVGVEHFYLYNNFSEDDYKTVLKKYIEDGIVTLIEWPKQQGQMSAYNDCIQNYKNESTWIGFIDIDEFVCPILENNIYSMLKHFEKNRPVVVFYWKMFCSSGKINRNEKNLVIEDFTVCWNKNTDGGKFFFNTNYDFNFEYRKNNSMHIWYGKFKNIVLPAVNIFNKPMLFGINNQYGHYSNETIPIQINHYFTKSYGEYLEKVSRGDAFYKDNPRDLDYFLRHDMNCTNVDYKIYKYISLLKIRMSKKDEEKC